VDDPLKRMKKAFIRPILNEVAGQQFDANTMA